MTVNTIDDKADMVGSESSDNHTTVSSTTYNTSTPDMLRRILNVKLHNSIESRLRYNEIHTQKHILRQQLWSKMPHLIYRQPSVFGPMPGPRQDHYGQSQSSTSSYVVTRTIKFTTSAVLLRNLFPTSSYSFTDAGSVATASFVVQTMGNMAWLAGGNYDLLGFMIHGVQYTKRDGEVLHGSFCPVMFENLADPILSGREELGFPKLWSEIAISDEPAESGVCRVSVAWRGAEWATFAWAETTSTSPQMPTPSVPEVQAAAPAARPDSDNVFVHKEIPSSNMAERGRHAPDASYAVTIPWAAEPNPSALPSDADTPPKERRLEASFQIHDLGFTKLPTIHHIVERLAEIPVYGVVQASIVRTEGVSDLSGARRIE